MLFRSRMAPFSFSRLHLSERALSDPQSPRQSSRIDVAFSSLYARIRCLEPIAVARPAEKKHCVENRPSDCNCIPSLEDPCACTRRKYLDCASVRCCRLLSDTSCLKSRRHKSRNERTLNQFPSGSSVIATWPRSDVSPSSEGLISNSNTPLGIASVEQALGMSTIPLCRPSTGTVERSI